MPDNEVNNTYNMQLLRSFTCICCCVIHYQLLILSMHIACYVVDIKIYFDILASE